MVMFARGGIEEGEGPDEAAIRELREECRLEGVILNELSHITYPPESKSYTYLVDIGHQTPQIGEAPELTGQSYLVDMAWLSLAEIPERDRAFLWWSGLLSIPSVLL